MNINPIKISFPERLSGLYAIQTTLNQRHQSCRSLYLIKHQLGQTLELKNDKIFENVIKFTVWGFRPI